MTPKMTDNEIIKALEEWRKKLVSDYQRLKLLDAPMDCFEESHGDTITNITNALDLINRLQAKNNAYEAKFVIQKGLIDHQQTELKRLAVLADLGNMRANDYRAMRNRYIKAEEDVVRLKKLLKEAEAKENRLAKQFYKSGVKDVVERLKRAFCGNSVVNIYVKSLIDEVTKELVGETK